MIICCLVVCVCVCVCVISFDYSSNSLGSFRPISLLLCLVVCSLHFVLVFYAVFYIFCHVYLRGKINVCTYVFGPPCMYH